MILPFCNLIHMPYTIFYGKLSTFLFRKLFHYSFFIFTNSPPPPFHKGIFHCYFSSIFLHLRKLILSLFSRKLFSRVLYISPGGRSFIYSQAPYLLLTELFIYFHFMNGGKKKNELVPERKTIIITLLFYKHVYNFFSSSNPQYFILLYHF